MAPTWAVPGLLSFLPMPSRQAIHRNRIYSGFSSPGYRIFLENIFCIFSTSIACLCLFYVVFQIVVDQNCIRPELPEKLVLVIAR